MPADTITIAQAIDRLSPPNQRFVRELVWKLLTLQGYESPGWRPPDELDARAFVNDWTAALLLGKSPASVRVYRLYVDKLLDASPTATPALLDAFMATRVACGAGSSTIANTIFALKSFFVFLVQRGVLSASPAQHLKAPPMPQRERRVPAPSDVARLLNSPYSTLRDRALILLFAGCGLRAAEALTLRPSSIKCHRLEVTVIGKGNRQRTVPMSEATASVLREHMGTLPESTPFAFPGRDPSDHLDESSLDYRFRYLSRRAGIAKITPHQLRHFFASVMLNDRANLKVVSQLLGHKSTSVTANVYWHVLGAEQRRTTHRKHDPLRDVLNRPACADKPVQASLWDLL